MESSKIDHPLLIDMNEFADIKDEKIRNVFIINEIFGQIIIEIIKKSNDLSKLPVTTPVICAALPNNSRDYFIQIEGVTHKDTAEDAYRLALIERTEEKH